ncbi:hypothetical protein MTR_8g037125 [Medicago truncatula]|uniref:Uncharacterized protein n=1 Tax=Medicago truncatula TaxID=3880 RepID=A0A072TNT1_MEDTR|nr:hypothetical protein MTR_8g037125 [Medicago truncatula]
MVSNRRKTESEELETESEELENKIGGVGNRIGGAGNRIVGGEEMRGAVRLRFSEKKHKSEELHDPPRTVTMMANRTTKMRSNMMLLSDSLEKRCAIKSDGCEVFMQST